MNTIEEQADKLAAALGTYLDQPEVAPKMRFVLILCPVGEAEADCECISNISRDDLHSVLKLLLARVECQPMTAGHA